MTEPSRSRPALITVGWREWVAFPAAGLPAVYAKVDTGAATSALHATGVMRFERDGHPWVRFDAHPLGRPYRDATVRCEAPVIDERDVRSSSGHSETRLVVRLTLRLGVRSDAPEWTVEVTLADRGAMAFPMLLGREALVGRVVVDPGRARVLGPDPPVEALYALGPAD